MTKVVVVRRSTLTNRIIALELRCARVEKLNAHQERRWLAFRAALVEIGTVETLDGMHGR